jgi:hypothetical protein
VTDVEIAFVGGPLDGVVSCVRTMPTGQPPVRFTIAVITPGGGGHDNHDYHRGRWHYEYAGIRSR